MNRTKNEILGNLYYNIGKQATNFRIFHNYYDNSEKKFSKWINYLDATEKDIEKATHRTLLKNEVVLDFDPEKGEELNDVARRVIKVCKELKRKKLKYECYYTGSRGYHIHIFIKDMFFIEDKNKRREFRSNIIKFFGAEVQKNSEGTAIALEGVPHWKSGKIKKRCFW